MTRHRILAALALAAIASVIVLFTSYEGSIPEAQAPVTPVTLAAPEAVPAPVIETPATTLETSADVTPTGIVTVAPATTAPVAPATTAPVAPATTAPVAPATPSTP